MRTLLFSASLLAALLLGACSDEPRRQPVVVDVNEPQEIAPDTTMYVEDGYERSNDRVIVLYHGPSYYQRNPRLYYTDPASAYNNHSSPLYHTDYGAARIKATAAAASWAAAHPNLPTPQMKRFVPTPARPKAPVVAPAPMSKAPALRYSTAPPTHVYTIPAPARVVATPKPAPTVTRTYSAPRTYSVPVRSAPAPSFHMSTSTSHPSFSHPSVSAHH